MPIHSTESMSEKSATELAILSAVPTGLFQCMMTITKPLQPHGTVCCIFDFFYLFIYVFVYLFIYLFIYLLRFSMANIAENKEGVA